MGMEARQAHREAVQAGTAEVKLPNGDTRPMTESEFKSHLSRLGTAAEQERDAEAEDHEDAQALAGPDPGISGGTPENQGGTPDNQDAADAGAVPV